MGNRSEEGAPWGLYRCAGEEQWVAITCRDDADWQGLVAAMGIAGVGGRRRAHAGVEGRRARADELDARIGEWTATQSEGRRRRRVPGAGRARGADAHRRGA